MYKLTAKLPNGLSYITNSGQVMDLQRLAVNLGAVSYSITNRQGMIIYSLSQT